MTRTKEICGDCWGSSVSPEGRHRKYQSRTFRGDSSYVDCLFWTLNTTYCNGVDGEVGDYNGVRRPTSNYAKESRTNGLVKKETADLVDFLRLHTVCLLL